MKLISAITIISGDQTGADRAALDWALRWEAWDAWDMAIVSCRAVGGNPDRLIGTARCGPACRVVWGAGARNPRLPD